MKPTKKISKTSLIWALISSFVITIFCNSFSPTQNHSQSEASIQTALDSMTKEIRNISVSNTPRSLSTFQFTDKSCNFTTYNNSHRTQVAYSLQGSTIMKTVAGKTEAFLKGVDTFEISFVDKTKKHLKAGKKYNSLPLYAQVKVSFKNQPESTYRQNVYYK